MSTAITVICPNCQNRMRASAEHLGKKGRCPACKELVEISASATQESLESIQTASATGTAATGSRGRDGTEASTWIAGLIGLLAAAVLYVFFFLLYRLDFLIGELFCARGSIPVILTVVTCWGFAMLAMKYIAVRRQLSYAELELELIPLDIGLQITPANVDQFLSHIGRLPAAQRTSVLGRRLTGALEHFKSRNSVPEVQEYVSTQAEIDASAVDSGYTLLRAFIWAIPILGFIGTVMGISEAVQGLSDQLSGETVAEAGVAADSDPASSDPAADGDASSAGLMAGLNKVTAGLSKAFDTTLIALAMAILLLFPTESLRKTEYRMLDRIEAFTSESLIRRMSDERAGLSAEDMPEVVRDALETAFAEHQRWLAQWQTQVSQLGQVIGADFESVFDRVQQQVSANGKERIEKLEVSTQTLEKMFAKVEDATATWHEAEQLRLNQSEQFLAATSRLQEALTDDVKHANDILERQARLLEMYSSEGFSESVRQLESQIGRLASGIGVQAGAGAPATSHEAGQQNVGTLGSEGNDTPGGFFSRLRGKRP